ncbi:MAG: class I SAM-dependent methyltransferase [Nitrososphaeraceae archaeon]|nr:class I SAM-dependent methyltransferase [Nitrososphaeraceae archaeon]
MSNIWDKIYSDDSAFFGEDPSDFAQKCYSYFKKYGAKGILELGCGQGRDTIFFASNGFDVHAIDASKVAIENINQKLRQKNISLDLRHFKARQTLPYDSSYFDAVYSHMFYNMRFTDEELGFLFKESHRVLKNNGLLYFSVRSDKDVLYNKGKKIDNNIYEVNGFQIRFFTKRQIQSFLENYFEIKNIEESYEEPVNLYFIFCRKK